MIIDCISDLHGYEPNLPGGDLLILGGDYTAAHKLTQWHAFFNWLEKQPYKKKIVIAGNHDNFLDSGFPKNQQESDDLKFVRDALDVNMDFEYLCDSGTEYEGLKIWGSPWTTTFPGINPNCCYFTLDTDEELSEKWKLIPDDIDILITHSPAYGILDRTTNHQCVGSKSLQMELFTRIKPKLFVCGHIHEAYGVEPKGGFVERAINASHVNEKYKPVNKPIRIIL